MRLQLQAAKQVFVAEMESNRIIVYGSTVFKLIYKLSEGAATPDEVKLLFNAPEHIQNDIEVEFRDVVVLARGMSKNDSCSPHPPNQHWGTPPSEVRQCCHLPRVDPWPGGNELRFFNGDCELSSHPEAILLLVHQTPDSQVPEKAERSSILGKHQRVCPEDEHLPLITGIPPLVALTRKRMKMDEREDVRAVGPSSLNQQPEMHPVSAVPPPSEAALPIGSQPGSARDPPSDKSVLQYGQKAVKRLEALSQSAPDSVTESRPGPFSVFSRVWRWWKSGW